MNDQTQICGDGALLLWYAAGALDPEESSQVARHVKECSRCEQLVRENEELTRLYRAIPQPEAQHLSSQDLVRLAESWAGASNLVAEREHVAGCEECRSIVSTVQQVNRELESRGLAERLGSAFRRLHSGWTAAAKNLSPWLASPLPAYLLMLALIYPAYLGLTGVAQRVEAPALLSPPLPIVSEVERGPGESRILLSPQDGHTVLTFFVPISDARYRYQIELTDQDGRTLLLDPEAESYDGLGTFALTLPDGSLEPGDYRLAIEEWDRESGEIANVFQFPFSVLKP
jgi:hypothetical protein